MIDLEKLELYLRKCADDYYNYGKSEIDDETYDAMRTTLQTLKPESHIIREIGSLPPENSKKFYRSNPMFTLSKYYKKSDVEEWFYKVTSKFNTDIILSPKYDGCACSLIYINGKLVVASTRGDGNVGEIVTEAVSRANIPTRIQTTDPYIEVRGEMIIPKKYRQILKDKGYTSLRNAVPGILRSSNDCVKYIDFILYDVVDSLGKSRNNLYTLLSTVGFKPESVLYFGRNFEKLSEIRDNFSKDDYIYECDGIVLKTDLYVEEFKSVPEYSIAWKYESKVKESIIRNIESNVGVTGSINVVYEFDPVEFQGAKLTRASAGSLIRHNETLKGKIGDHVLVTRQGDIIPYIKEVISTSNEEFVPIDECPSCHSKLVDNICINKECPEILRLRIVTFVTSLGVKGIGSGLVDKLINAGMLKSIADIYRINPEDIQKLPRCGYKQVENWRILQNKKLRTTEFFVKYPFNNLGESFWKSILRVIPVRDLLDVNEGYVKYEEKIIKYQISGVGSSKIASMYSTIRNYRNDIIDCLNYNGISITL